MKLKELPVGSKVVFGSYTANSANEPKELIWTKVTDDGKIVLEPFQVAGSFDSPEHGAVNRDRKAHGYNYFPFANVFQFINSPEASWFHPMHEGDAARYAMHWGFLASFSSEELSAIRPQEIQVGVPEGSRKQFGRKTKLQCLVTLPSASQYSADVEDYLQCEGDLIPLLSDPNVFRGWTRSGTMDTSHVIAINWDMDNLHCDRYTNICPMVLLNQELETSDAPDEYGRYYIKIKTKIMEDIMTDDFLKMIFQ
ncbi:MAG: hypothetical protein IKN04_10480 [Clostridia bacterium]|nr:hypothetical protein [Clostridia bacterium]